jgi:opacity protein-like surface antigen
MKLPFKLSPICLALLASTFFLNSTNAQPLGHASKAYKNGYEDGYDDGCEDCYEDGYEDAMDDCECPPVGSLLGGFYLGGAGGYEGYMNQRSVFLLNERIGSFRSHANGWYGNAFAGYGRYFHRAYLGGEIFAGGSSADGRDSENVGNFGYNGKYSIGASFGIEAVPGYKLNNGALLFGKAGFISTQMSVNETSGIFERTEKRWQSGYILGVGTELPLNRNFGLRFEYDYINYGTIRLQGDLGSNNSLSDNRATVGLNYHLK